MKKYVAQVVLETTAPLAIGAGKSSLDNEAMVAKDFNGLPYMPGSGLAGVLSTLFEEQHNPEIRNELFGGKDAIYQESEKEGEKETFKGSHFEFSDAYLIDFDDADNYGKVHQQVVSINELSRFHQKFLTLPRREHVKIDYRGVAEDKGKFNNEFVYKGARFKFEIEFQDKDGTDEAYWEFILNAVRSSDFLQGSGTTNSYGQTKPVSIKTKTYDYDLLDKEDFISYLNHTVDLNAPFDGKDGEDFDLEKVNEKWNVYKTLSLNTNAIHIGAGYGDFEVDNANYTEYCVVWNTDDTPEFKHYFVIPGSSVKGSIAHRVAFYQNKKDENFVELAINNYENALKENIDKNFKHFSAKIEEIKENTLLSLQQQKESLECLQKEIEQFQVKVAMNPNEIFGHFTGSNNTAVKTLFGSKSDDNGDKGSIGKVIFDDIYIPIKEVEETIFDHNAIDRFTGGTIDTALFSEKVFTPKSNFILTAKIYEDIDTPLLDMALTDIANGNLALGGKTNKGYGYFTRQKEQDENGEI